MSDETTWQVNKEKDKKASNKSYIWIHRTGKPIILYQYTRSRSGDHAKSFLNGFNGYHVSDAYAGYEKVEGITAYKYLEYIFCQLPNINFASNGSVLEEYLPWSDQVQLECKINTEETNLKE